LRTKTCKHGVAADAECSSCIKLGKINRKYYTSEKGVKCLATWRRSPKAKECEDRYRKTTHGRAVRLHHSAFKRSEVLGLAFSLTLDRIKDVIDQGFCEVTGLPFVYETNLKGPGKWMPSIDRIVPSEGYTDENTQVVVWAYNAAKGIGTSNDVMILARALVASDPS